MDDLTAAELASAEVLWPGSADYDDARRVHNGLIDRFPAVIVRCRQARQVAAAITAARERGLEISVRGGGHNVAGRAVGDGGLMIDLALMRDIAVDPAARTIDAGPGLNWGEFNVATQAHGLAVTGGTISTTGISGLTLGGGLGWLMGKFGLAADNLLQAELVTANGAVITASETEHPDLFWALRGGGGNFGVVTSFRYRLYPVGPVITGGFRFFPIDEAAGVLRLFRDMTTDIPDDLSLVAALVRTPDESRTPVAGVIACHAGPEAQAEKDLAALRAFGRNPVVDALIRKPYTDVNSQFDYGFPKGALNYWKSSFMSGLPDEAIEAMIDAFVRCPSPMSIMMIEDLHGAATRVPVTATAIPHRGKGYNLLVPSVWTDPRDTDRNIAWTRQAYASLAPSLTAGRYVNYLDDDEAELFRDPVRDAYGPNYERLTEVKAAYDPDNIFHRNQNIRPAGTAATWAP